MGISRRVVITGLGIIAPNGTGKENFWHAISLGVSGIRPIQRFSTQALPVSVAGEVPDFDPTRLIDRKLLNRTDRVTQFTLAAVQQAIEDARLEIAQIAPERVGAVIANNFGGVEYVLKQMQALHTRGPRSMSAYTAIAWLQVANIGQISIRYGLQGYGKTPVNDATSGLDALGMAARAIRRGAADLVIAGGSEALLHPFTLLMMQRQGLCAAGDDPEIYRPFDVRARGMLLGEGAGILILEEYEHALARGATIYSEIAGYTQTNDAYPLGNPVVEASDCPQYLRALRQTLAQADLNVHDLGYLSADGRGNPLADAAEAHALQELLGEDLQKLPVSVPRTMLGHCSAAAGAIDTIIALLALCHHQIPPTIHSKQIDPRYTLNFVLDEAQPLHKKAVLLGARGQGGMNAALALRAI